MTKMKNDKEGLVNILKNSNLWKNVLIHTFITTPICACLGCYLGEHVGEFAGKIIDNIPIIREVTPYFVERIGLIPNVKTIPNVNENFYQTVGFITGLCKGWIFPIKYFHF
ncbi:MAG: hypothetical protein KJ949_02110 [Nanoarchaeota archaeon]|nr:hypothetical protein [Nanoarchaeota archaeon]